MARNKAALAARVKRNEVWYRQRFFSDSWFLITQNCPTNEREPERRCDAITVLPFVKILTKLSGLSIDHQNSG